MKHLTQVGFKWMLFVGLVVGMMGVFLPAAAQDGDQEILERLAAIEENWQPADYTSGEREITENLSTIVIPLPDGTTQTIITDETITLESTETLFNVSSDDEEELVLFTLTVERLTTESDGTDETVTPEFYVLEGELRWVDDRLYVQVVLTDGETTVVFPDGWFEITAADIEAETWDILSPLDIDDYFDTSDDEENSFDTILRVNSGNDAAVLATVEKTTTDDGQEADRITIEIDSAAFYAESFAADVESGEIDPLTLTLFTDYLSPESVTTAVMTITPDDQPIESLFESLTVIEIEDYSTVDQGVPVGTKVSFRIYSRDEERTLGINQGLTIEAPVLE